ncbi:translocation/assembly module TamB domain-containing protein [Pseudooceanicola aestuarii]|uniref:translocation/assembly module TamB domain-containing protein n=1 Tax=Pseudooceanicola aestuarii TaxID=2697319 RepID=UPI0013D42A45|nr:translocation/assembly module TamB domain-containing protein [Pseudooceanicola aestuarii]
MFYHLLTRLCLALAACLMLGAAPAQAQSTTDEDEGFLTRLIQDNLSGAGRVVDIQGFRGALSSRATLERMTIADDDGIWLELTGAVLDWDRSALLGGRLQVQELSAETLVIRRIPEGDGASTEAPGFAIPDLPVSVNIDRFDIGAITLEDPLLGERVDLTAQGSAALAGGGMDVDLAITRTDRDGRFAIDAAFDPEAEALALDITLTESEGGLAAKLMDLPGLPSVDLTIAGTGPLDDYRAELDLTTDGTPRLGGFVALQGQEDGGRRFTADLGGDITALAAPDYRDFLGTDIGLVVEGLRSADGALDITQLDLTSAALNLGGQIAVDAEGAPERFDLAGELVSPQGESRVTLPFGEGISLARADLSLQYDRSVSEAITGRIVAEAPDASGLSADQLALNLDGTLTPTDSDLNLRFDAAGLSTGDAALAQALGRAIEGAAHVTWGEDAPLRIADLSLTGESFSLKGDAILDQGEEQAALNITGRAELPRLANFAALSGTDLRGAASLSIDIDAQLPSGVARVQAQGDVQDLALGVDQLDPLLAPPAQLKLDVTRGTDGIELTVLRIGNEEIELTASGAIGDSDGAIDYALRLENAGIFTGAESGPLTLDGAVRRIDRGLRVTARGAGDELATGVDAADKLLSGRSSLAFSLFAGDDRLLLEEALITTDELRLEASGDLSAPQRQVEFSARLANSALFTGGEAGALEVDGTLTQQEGRNRVSLTGGGTDLGIGTPMVDNLLEGRTDLLVELVQGEGLLRLDRARVENDALTLSASGNLVDGARDVTLTGTLNNSARPFGGRAGPLNLSATARQDGADYVLSLDADGQAIGIGTPAVDDLLPGTSTLELRARYTGDGALEVSRAEFDGVALSASASGVVADGGADLDLSARLDDVARLTPGLSGPVTISGSANAGAEATALNLSLTGPGGSQARATGQVGLPGGRVALEIEGTAPLALANAFIAPQSLGGMARFDLTMQGAPGLEALSGRISTTDARVVIPSASVVVERIAGDIALSGGQARLNITADYGGGAVRVTGPVGLSTPYSAGLDIAVQNVLVERDGLVSTRLDGALRVAGPVTGGGRISGRIGLRDTELRIPAGGFGGQETIPDIRHLGEPADSRTTRRRAGLTDADTTSAEGSGSGSAGLGLDVLVAADDPIFLRGRGLDAELRGQLRLQGTTSEIRPVGQFELVRGRLDILTKRLDLAEGRLVMAGAFEPVIRLVAASTSGEYVIQIILDGPAGEPEVTFASTPELPEDEILSQLFFGRDLNSLSPLQAARLAVAVAELTGRGNGGVVGKLRENAGLDDLDIAQTEDGETALRAGKYINDNVYTQTEVTSSGETSLSINLDISDNVRAKGSVSSDGDTGLGLFFEKDY